MHGARGVEILDRVRTWFPESDIAEKAKEVRYGIRSDRTVRENTNDHAAFVPRAGRPRMQRAGVSADCVPAGPHFSPAWVGSP